MRLVNGELAALSNFSLPEYYFRIFREEAGGGAGAAAHTGKYFSRIERIAWGDM